jgi:RHS repeat-associated protein
MPPVSDSLRSGVVNPSSGAPDNALGHCKDNGNGHANQQPAGCSGSTLTFGYEYDSRGLVTQRDVVTDQGTTRTSYAHDALGRLVRSVTGDVGKGGRGCAGAGSVASVYAWDAASNLVGEGGTDDPSTSKSGDAYAIARTVNEVNQLVTVVKDPVGTRGGKVETTQFSYDGRGNRTGSVTTTQAGKKTQVESRSTFSYDGMDQLTSTSGPQGSASWARDGMGRAVTVKEDGQTANRLYDGFQVVAEGDTQLTLAPNGQTLSETTTTWTIGGKGKCRTGVSVESVDILTDVLGSAVATASDGVISKDLALYGDFGEALTTPEVDTVTGFTGKVTTAGLVEFASRTYDPTTRQWVQDDRYRGTTTRASSMNRYAYVEGAPESFVDVLGFYRAAAALQAQKLAAVQAANQAAATARAAVAPKCSGYACYSNWLHQQQVNAMYAETYGPRAPGTISGTEAYAHGVWVAAEKERVRAREQAKIDAYNKSLDKGYWGGLVDTLSIGGNGALSFVKTIGQDTWDAVYAIVEYSPVGEGAKFLADPGFYFTEKKQQLDAAWQGVQWAYHNPTDAWVAANFIMPKLVLKSLWDPIKECWDAGDYGCAVAHADFDVTLVLSMFASGGATAPATAVKVESTLAKVETTIAKVDSSVVKLEATATKAEAAAAEAAAGLRAAGSAASASDRVSAPLWTSTKAETSAENALAHYVDHGGDFPEVGNALEYVADAQNFLRTPPPGTLTIVRTNGDIVRYDPATNIFGVMDSTGAPRTFFKPDPAKHGYPTNMDYFNAQQW